MFSGLYFYCVMASQYPWEGGGSIRWGGVVLQVVTLHGYHHRYECTTAGVKHNYDLP